MENKGKYRTISDPKLDSRVKLTPELKQQILDRAITTGKVRQTAREFGVGAMTVYYILHPEKQKENKQLFQEKGNSTKYLTKTQLKISRDKYAEKKRNMLKEIRNENMFTLLRGLNEGQLVTRLTLKDNTTINECTVTNNDTEFKQLEVGDTLINYSDVKTVIFKTK